MKPVWIVIGCLAGVGIISGVVFVVKRNIRMKRRKEFDSIDINPWNGDPRLPSYGAHVEYIWPKDWDTLSEEEKDYHRRHWFELRYDMDYDEFQRIVREKAEAREKAKNETEPNG